MLLIADHLSYKYDKLNKKNVLDDVSFSINKGEIVSIIGHTGSGKSTLIEHFNALNTPTEGTIYYDGKDIFEKDYDRKALRAKVGLVFQYPDHQLFEETVYKDVCFGPTNLGLDKKEVELRAYEALKKVGVEDDLFFTSPFELSGGQKKKVTIAGVLAMKPEVLVLDEPTAGLDPKWREEILNIAKRLRDEDGVTIILVSHSMEDVARYFDHIIVMDHGKKLLDGTVDEVFEQAEVLREASLDIPESTAIMRLLRKEGYMVNTAIYDADSAVREIRQKIRF
jgi:energy-coupling factor transport system ATP-binding protein